MNQPEGAKPIWTIGDLLSWTETYFAQKGIESPRLDAQVLLAHVLGCERIQIYTRFTETALEEQRERFRELVRRRIGGCPVAYLVGRKEFYQLTFEVTPVVMIPRPATETLVLAALERAKPLPAPQILDVGTGSGCVAICLARHHAGAIVTAVDASPDALAVARRNAARHLGSKSISFVESDLFAALPRSPRFDLIVCNPPYIPTRDLADLQSDVRDHEPRQALDGGPDGFTVIDRILNQAGDFLAAGGWLLLEIGAGQRDAMEARIQSASGLSHCEIIGDPDGHARVAIARRS